MPQDESRGKANTQRFRSLIINGTFVVIFCGSEEETFEVQP